MPLLADSWISFSSSTAHSDFEDDDEDEEVARSGKERRVITPEA
jgi:hypothetical protein